MESLNDIKKRIKSVTDISQMTHAMQLVSASKMRKSKIQHEKVSPFFTLCAESLMELHGSAKDIDNPFLQMRERKSGTTWKIAYFILTGDQGLAGAYNNNIVKIAEEHIQKKILENAKNSIRTEYKLYVFGHYEFYNPYMPSFVQPKYNYTKKIRMAFGLNYYPLPQIAVKAEYSHRFLQNPYNNEPSVSLGIAYQGFFL